MQANDLLPHFENIVEDYVFDKTILFAMGYKFVGIANIYNWHYEKSFIPRKVEEIK